MTARISSGLVKARLTWKSYVTDSGYNLHMDIQQRLNLDLMERLSDFAVQFAFRTRMLHMRSGEA